MLTQPLTTSEAGSKTWSLKTTDSVLLLIEIDKYPTEQGFRMRGREMTRIETFTDAAFAFALTLLVVSYDGIPGSYSELMTALKGIPAFAASFLIMVIFWHAHSEWSRHYGLQDKATVVCSGMLVFTVLVYVYPLKLIFASLFYWLSDGWFPLDFSYNSAEFNQLFIIYHIGHCCMSGSILLLYCHAYRQRDALQLDDREAFETRTGIQAWWIVECAGLLALTLALSLPQQLAYWTPMIYSAIPLVMSVFMARRQKRRARILAPAANPGD